MKKILFAIALFTSHLTIAQTTNFKYGLHFGIGSSVFTGAGITAQPGKLSLSFGGTACLPFNPFFDIVGEALIVSKGSTYRGNTVDSSILSTTNYKYTETTSLFYAEIPLLLKFKYGGHGVYVKAFGGPSFNFNLFGLQSRTYDNANYNEKQGFQNNSISDIGVLEISGVLGAGIDIETLQGSYSLDFRINNGITSWNKDTRNSYYQIGVGYMF